MDPTQGSIGPPSIVEAVLTVAFPVAHIDLAGVGMVHLCPRSLSWLQDISILVLAFDGRLEAFHCIIGRYEERPYREKESTYPFDNTVYSQANYSLPLPTGQHRGKKEGEEKDRRAAKKLNIFCSKNTAA